MKKKKKKGGGEKEGKKVFKKNNRKIIEKFSHFFISRTQKHVHLHSSCCLCLDFLIFPSGWMEGGRTHVFFFFGS